MSVERVVSTIKLYNSLIVPVQIELNDSITIKLQEQILKETEKYRAKLVIIDLSLIDIIDSYVARILIETADMLHLLGCTMYIVGMQPAVALTLSEMGVNFERVKTALSIESILDEIKRWS